MFCSWVFCGQKGVGLDTKMAMISATIATIGLIAVAVFAPTHPWLITAPICLLSISVGFAWNVFATEAMALFPHLKGSASAMMTMVRLVCIGFVVFLGAALFDGTIKPLVLISVSTTLGALGMYRYICRHKKIIPHIQINGEVEVCH